MVKVIIRQNNLMNFITIIHKGDDFMIYSYSTSDQTVAVNATISFENNGIKSGRCITHAVGTGSFSLNRVGYYLVHFNADVATSAAAGNATVQLYINGEAYEGAEATGTTSVAATDVVNLGFETIIQVLPNCCVNINNLPLTLTIRNTGLEAIFSNVALTIVKVG